jgi:hypothetical protein
MNVLIGCEESGTVRDSFAALGHKVLSCDIQPTRSHGPHYEGDIFDVIDYPWDLAIFHPPCTHTSVSGAKHFEEKWMDGRQAVGVAFFMNLMRRSAHIPKTVFEQPISIMSSLYRKPDQIIQPWQFGHAETKATCLWLKGVSSLQPTQIVDGRADRIHKMPPGPTRARERSVTYAGIARAMAQQWGSQNQSRGLF